MKICFLEIEPVETAYFARKLAAHELLFVDSLVEVPFDVDIVSVFIGSPIGEAFLEAHPRLKFIATRSTTLDHLDLDACTRRGVAIGRVESYGDHIVAEHTFALLLAVTKRLREAMEVPRQSRFSYEGLRGVELRGKTFGIIGAGRIGLHTIPIARAFGMKVLAHDIAPHPSQAEALGFEYVTFETLLRRSDIISLHAPLTAETFHLLDREAFAKCRPGVIMINTARGRLIDTVALLEALDAGIVGGAGLDVLGEESVFRRDAARVLTDQILDRLHTAGPAARPEDERARAEQIEKLICLGKLLARPNVVFTPHTAFNCIEALERIDETTVANINSFINGTLPSASPGSSPHTRPSDEYCLASNGGPIRFETNPHSIHKSAAST